MSKGIWVKVKNFSNYKGRIDVKNHSWFRLSNRILEDPDFFDFTHAEILAWIYVLSLASQKNSDTVYINFLHAERVCRLKKKEIQAAIEKLLLNQLDPVDVTDACATGQYITVHNNTEQDITLHGNEESTSVDNSLKPQDLINLWNENSGNLSKVQSLTKSREGLVKKVIQSNPDLDFWLSAITRARDIFDQVPKSEWRFNFDNLLSEAKLTKLLEGGYDFLKTKHLQQKQTFAQMKSTGNARIVQLAREGAFDEYEG
jgi:hypothetical protein